MVPSVKNAKLLSVHSPAFISEARQRIGIIYTLFNTHLQQLSNAIGPVKIDLLVAEMQRNERIHQIAIFERHFFTKTEISKEPLVRLL